VYPANKMRERTNTNIKANTERRITIFMAVFALLFLVILYKLFNIQVMDAARYQLAAKNSMKAGYLLNPPGELSMTAR